MEADNCTISLMNNTPGKLSLIDLGLTSGKWGRGPLSQVPSNATPDKDNYTEILYAMGPKATADGVYGHVTYQAHDNKTQFKIEFKVPYAKSNYASIVCLTGDCSSFTYKLDDPPNWPPSGSQINSTMSIRYKNWPKLLGDVFEPEVRLVGAERPGVTPSALIHAVACDEITARKIRKAFGSKEEAWIEDVLNAADFDPADKVSAIIRAGFLSDDDLRRLAIDFAEHVAPDPDDPVRAAYDAALSAHTVRDSQIAIIHTASSARQAGGADEAEWQLDLIRRKYVK